MDLILWRHAEAEDGFPDDERKLTKKGLKQAQKMAQWLRPRIPGNTRIIVSPTKRTLQTAAALVTDTDEYEILPQVGPGATADSIIRTVNWPYEENTVLVVGHQPTLGQISSLLYIGDDAGFSVKKGSVWWFSYKDGNDRGNTILRAVMTPEMT